MKRILIIKNLFSIIILLAIQLILTSCATTTSQIAFHEEPFKDKQSAIIYVYRLPSAVGSAVKWQVVLDQKLVANLSMNAYAAIHTHPGKHTLIVGGRPISIISAGLLGGAAGGVVAESVNQSVISAAIEKGTFSATANEAYFFRVEGPNVSFVTREEAMKEIINMKFDMGL